jgi:PKD repeat protein
MKTKLTSMKTQITSMKKHLLRTAVVALLAAIAFTATGPANAQLINGSFIKGCNLAWEDGAYNTWLGLDPTEPGWGIAYNSAHLNSHMASMHSMGITVLRVWVNEADMGDTINGSDYVTGVTSTWTANFANMVQLAANNRIQLYVTLNDGRSDWLENPAQAGAYLTNALIPLINTYKGNTNIFAIDLMNEIDGVVQGPLGNYTSTGATWAQAEAYISTFAAAIHSADPSRKVTCSTGWHQWYNLSYFLGLGLDFYDFHNYQDTPSFPSASSLGMDKPIYIGECGQGTDEWNDSIQSTCELDALNSARSGGYAGVGIWDYEYAGSSEIWSMVNTNGTLRPVCNVIQGWSYGATIFFTANPNNGTAPLTVQFTCPSVDSRGNTVTNWNWNFGDGSTSTTQNPSHVYTNIGTFLPSLVATNNLGDSVTGSGPSISVSQPTVQYTANPTAGPIPLTVQFTSPGVDSGGSAITRWNWSFGDGATSTTQNPSHVYTNVGTFLPSLVATNNLGYTVIGSGTAPITATNAPVYSGLVLNGGFETGNFTGWTLVGAPIETFVDDGSQSGITPHSGSYEAALGTSRSLGYLSQTLHTTAGASYLLSLWLNSPDGQTPNGFLVSWNGNTLLDETNLAAFGWTNIQFMVTATGTSTVLQFGFRDDPSYLGLDDISVVTKQLGITGISLSGTNLVIKGSNGQSGGTYKTLMSTNLALPLNQWTPVATNALNASENFAIIATNAVNRNVPQRFYILQMQ